MSKTFTGVVTAYSEEDSEGVLRTTYTVTRQRVKPPAPAGFKVGDVVTVTITWVDEGRAPDE